MSSRESKQKLQPSIQAKGTIERAAIKEAEKILKCKNASLETKNKFIHTMGFPITKYKSERWEVRKAVRSWCSIGALQILHTAETQPFLNQMKAELSLKAN